MSDLGLKIKITTDGKQGESGLQRIVKAVEGLANDFKALSKNIEKLVNDTSALVTAGKQGESGLNRMGNAAEGASNDLKTLSKDAEKLVNDTSKLVTSGKQGESGLKVMGKTSKDLANDFKTLSKNTEKLANETGKLATDVTRSLGHYGAGIYAVKQAFDALSGTARDVIATTAKFDGIGRALTTVTGSSQQAAQQFQFLQKTASTLGIDLASAAGAYTKLAASARGTLLAGEDTDKIFTAIAKSSSALGLTAADTEGALLAIGQMMSKGTVYAEELRGQLGERLPGAFQAMAKAVGVSSAELSKMLEQGQVGIDVLPKFAAELERLSSGANLDGLQNNINRLGNEWDRLKLTVGNSAPINEGMKSAADALKSFNDQADRIISVVKVAGELLVLYFGGKALGALGRFGSKMLESHAATKAMAEAAEKAAQKVGPFGEKIWQAEKATTAAAQKAGVMEFAIDKMGAVAQKVADNPLQALIAALFAANGAARAFSQESDDLITKINSLNENIRLHREQGMVGSTISSYLGYDENKLLNQRDSLVKQLEKQAEANNRTATAAFNNDLVDRGIEDANKRLHEQQEKAAAAAKKAAGESKKAADQLQSAYESTALSLQKQIKLHGDNSAAAEMAFEIQFGGLAKLNDAQRARLQALAAEKDLVEQNDARQSAMWQQLVDDANEFVDVTKAIQDFAAGDVSQAGFNTLLGRIQDDLDAGILSAEQAKKKFDELGRAFNEGFVEPAKDGTDELSEFSIQAARNMETAFADFLFDPFDKGMDGMLESFMTTIKRMVAEAASAQIMEALLGKTTKDGGHDWAGGLLGAAFSGIGGLFGGGGLNADISALTANSSLFANGGIMTTAGPLPLNKYANGGIANSPQLALFGEGRMNEAYVPLPDGRSIPVTMSGDTGGTVNNVTINVQGGNNPDETGRRIGEAFIRTIAREEINSASRPGNRLNPTTKF